MAGDKISINSIYLHMINYVIHTLNPTNFLNRILTKFLFTIMTDKTLTINKLHFIFKQYFIIFNMNFQNKSF